MTGWNLGDLVELVADAVPSREAVVCGATRRTFASLDARVNQLAHWLRSRGVGPGDRVGLDLHNRPEHVEALFAAFKLRAVPVNLNYRYTADELRTVLDDARPAVVVHEAELAPTIAATGTSAERLAVGDAYEAALAGQPSTRPHVDRGGDDRYLIYTGGTTGVPRGVEWRHEDLIFGALGGLGLGDAPGRAGGAGPEMPAAIPAEPSELASIARAARSRLLPACPLIHGTAQWTALATLLTGATVVLHPSPSLDAAGLWDLVDRERVTQLVIVGDAFARPLLDALDAEPHRWDLSSLLVVTSGGAALSPALGEGLLDHIPTAAVVNGYGTSETGAQGRSVTFAGQSQPGPQGLLGFQPDDTTAVLDESFRPLPPGSERVGRIGRRGHIPLGYRNDPERTAAVFPVVDGVRWSIPGDLATVDADGRVVLLGRDSNTINSGGEKVFAEEVELVLRSHPAVFDAVVVGMPDARWGERVAAVVALRHDASTDGTELERWCRGSLAGFKVPRQVVFVPAVQRRPSGKSDLLWTRARLSAVDPDSC